MRASLLAAQIVRAAQWLEHADCDALTGYAAGMRAVFVLIKTEPGHVTEVAKKIGEIETFSEAYSISGEHDLLVKLYVDDLDAVGRIIERDLHSIPHLRSTFTILTFEAFGGRH